MKVEMIGWSTLRLPERVLDTNLGDRIQESFLEGIPDSAGDLLPEIAGRLCYDSYALPNKATATNADYLANIIKQRHFSVLEHASATFLITGVSRSLLMEMRTHRHASFSARSTRYVDEEHADYVLPPALVEHVNDAFEDDPGWTVGRELASLMGHSTGLYARIVDLLIAKGATRKEAREAAREVLPGATATEFVMTANHHAWREILAKRTAPGAAREIREVSQEILRLLKSIAPNVYQDM